MRNLSKALRALVVGGASLGLVGAMALPASAISQDFNVNVVAGELLISPALAPNALGGAPACSDGLDSEYDPAGGAGWAAGWVAANPLWFKDTLVDFGFDPQCTTPFDNSEREAGFQAAAPITMQGSIDDVTGAWAVPTAGFTFPSATLTITAPLLLFVSSSVAADVPVVGTFNYVTGAIDVTTMDLSFDLGLCGPGLGCFEPPAPYGGGAGWSLHCIADVNPPDLNTDDPLVGSAYNAAAGVATVGDYDDPIGTPLVGEGFVIPLPVDGVPPGGLGCAFWAGSFGLPTDGTVLGIPADSSSLTLQLSTNGPLPASYIAVGNATAVEPGAVDGTVKLTFPITVSPAVPGPADLTFTTEATGITATEGKFKPSTPSVNDFKSVDLKAGKVKATKTTGKISVTVWGDAIAAEGSEYLTASIIPGTLSDASYTIVHGTALGTIVDGVGGGVVSLGDTDIVEGSAAGGTAVAKVPVTLDGPALPLLDVTVGYCLAPITAVMGVDYSGTATSACFTSTKFKTIKATKSSTSIAVKVYQDAMVESDDAVAVMITGVVNATPGDSVGIVQIKTDES